MKDQEKRRRVIRALDAAGALHLRPEEAVPLRRSSPARRLSLRRRAARSPRRSGPVDRAGRERGCASKIDRATLTRVLAGLPSPDDPRVLVGMPAGDDAGVYQLDDQTALVQTVDVFSPSVDDPYLFGQVAAANSLSNVYAMGGRPITALSIIGFPVRSCPTR